MEATAPDAADSLSRRLDRLESIEQIRALAVRYAMAMDARDIDAALDLYTEDTPVSRGVRGRSALKDVLHPMLGGFFTTTVHFIGNHLIELDAEDPDRATGRVYCKAEHEMGERWVIVMLQYFDKYRRDGGTWHFYSRQVRRWYAVDALDRPSGPDKIRVAMHDHDLELGPAELPDWYPTWGSFWADRPHR